MTENFLVMAAFALAGIVAVISLYGASVWLPRKMEKAYGNALKTLATAVETKDSRTLGHAERVADMVVQVAARMGLSGEEIRRARYAGLMRDIGKVAVPHRILNKEGPLTEGELRVVRNHVREGANIVSQVSILEPLTHIILHHHERWDGSGYPDGLAGEAIPLTSRIIAVVDDYEAMRSERPYHPAQAVDAATAEIAEGAGSVYDPAVVKAFLEVIGRPAEEVAPSREEAAAA